MSINKEEMDQWCRERGYTLHSRSTDGMLRTYSKQFDKFFLSLTVGLEDAEMTLQGFPGMFSLSTGSLQICHPNFEKFFEKRMVQMMTAIENDNSTIDL